MTKISYDDANAGKADFEWTYNRLDPRAYFDVLGALDYAIPERAAPVFLRVFDAYATERHKDALTVIDLGCSYGINAAVLKYGRRMDELRAHYLSFDEDNTPPHDVLKADQKAFTEKEARRDLHIIGLDRAQFASSYGFWAGLLDDAIPENFEENDPSPQAAKAMAKCDLLISTGVVGYVTERTFQRIVACQPQDDLPWIASFVLRMFDYGPVAKVLEPHGYVTEKLAGRYFRQRRFAGAAEKAHVETLLHARGLDPEGLEGEGHYLAEFFLSRPKADAEAAPLTRIVPR
ncbi:MAG: hypothetical protein KGR48_16060 [Alphaproteobacteria bacterium]|nr:hypothetical protein [Alphaproteobacteria bacterium]MBU6472073.1 hypothetical protein [Alphaproteobacteria bacterium]MDE2014807.1 hypothetical protein [Alphaproteobacteria bacterium]MDE2073301.1 hypothetical protein [Alphaproteobacteria bacterium]MDE2351609.1 hypothetical protein [Alphaproteobacteria bacterium]